MAVSKSIIDIVKALPDSQTAGIDILTADGLEMRLRCVFKESTSPLFFLVFPPKMLPDALETGSICPVSIKVEKTTLTLNAEIISINGDRTLELKAKKSIDPTSLREFFRVDSRLPITATYNPGPNEDKDHYWSMEGETLDVSGSGVLAIFPEPPENKHRVELSIKLNHTRKVIESTAHVIRTRRLRKGRFQVALHFDFVSPKHRDLIISNCLQEQRQQLRDKIQTAS